MWGGLNRTLGNGRAKLEKEKVLGRCILLK